MFSCALIEGGAILGSGEIDDIYQGLAIGFTFF
jgi:hypothetical protein